LGGQSGSAQSYDASGRLTGIDPISVRYRTPTVAIKNRCRKKPQAKGIAGTDGTIDHMEIVIEKDNITTLNEMLISIANCSYGGGGEKDRAGKQRARTIPGRDPLWNTRAKDERGEDIFIRTREAASYITGEFYTMMEVFCVSENLGCLPFAGGWAEQPAWIAQALSVLTVEKWRVDEEERESARLKEEDVRKHGRR
ncbi:MAG: hypothetical protein LBT87_02360, partial [Treponema sp.]|nr:hypothetical protein [Treponema sp.]